ncbi:MAG: hypothetical protein A2Y24_04650 [Clostridiales bacterium GWE2_32_10]|nr:MAG: hypothetical protein A2Y24_04650 [Clostridiales bacterium GWE2_32_10]HBY21568.1 hypothetical protein [Clostridiales bacterium]
MKYAKAENFGYGREMRRIFQLAITEQVTRLELATLTKDNMMLLTKSDVRKAVQQVMHAMQLVENKNTKIIGF